MQVWSSASEHAAGGASNKKDKISEYLKSYVDLPFTMDQPPALRAKLATTYACFILGASHEKGSAATGIRGTCINELLRFTCYSNTFTGETNMSRFGFVVKFPIVSECDQLHIFTGKNDGGKFGTKPFFTMENLDLKKGNLSLLRVSI